MNDSIITTIKKERKMLNFQRLAGTRKIRSYNLAEHSYFVGLMFQELAEELGIKISIEALGTVFRHDFMEVFTTDLPWQVKHLSPKTEEAWSTIERAAYNHTPCKYLYSDEQIKNTLTEEQYILFKWCDILELLLFCLEEEKMGNQGSDLRAVINNCRGIVDDDYMNQYWWGAELYRLTNTICDDIHI